MEGLLEKIDNFLFDIFGLVFPGLLFLFVLFAPAYFYTVEDLKSNSALYSLAKTWTRLSQLETSYQIAAFFALAYLIGHVVKAFAGIFYDFGELIFDKTLLKLGGWLKNWFSKFSSRPLLQAINPYWQFVEKLLKKCFKFTAPNYNESNQELVLKSTEIINQKTGSNFPKEWYTLYKFSTAVQNQENIKSLTANYLSKYNFYRSAAFVFAVNQVYMIFLFDFLEPAKPYLGDLKWNFYIANLILFFTFHVKYKRYWTLCGNEALVSLFYFLHSEKFKTENQP